MLPAVLRTLSLEGTALAHEGTALTLEGTELTLEGAELALEAHRTGARAAARPVERTSDSE